MYVLVHVFILCASCSALLIPMAIYIALCLPASPSRSLIRSNSKVPIRWRIYKRIHTGSFEAIYLCMMKKTCLFLYFITFSHFHPSSSLRLVRTPSLAYLGLTRMLHIRFLSLFHSSTSFHLAFFSVNLMRFAFNAILSYHAKYTLSMSERAGSLKDESQPKWNYA